MPAKPAPRMRILLGFRREPISKIGRRRFRGISEREARSFDEEYRCIPRRKSWFAAGNNRKRHGCFPKLFSRWALSIATMISSLYAFHGIFHEHQNAFH